MTIFTANDTLMTVRIFVTGGTFDKEYNEITGELCVRPFLFFEADAHTACNFMVSSE